jgi:predicted nucleic acid-binding protein
VSYLVHTNVLSEMRKGDQAHAAVRAWLSGVSAEDFYVSVLTLGEIRRGIERVRLRGDHGQAHRLDAWLVRLETLYAGRVLPIDVRVADLWGRLQVPDPLPVVDACSPRRRSYMASRSSPATSLTSSVRRLGFWIPSPQLREYGAPDPLTVRPKPLHIPQRDACPGAPPVR